MKREFKFTTLKSFLCLLIFTLVSLPQAQSGELTQEQIQEAGGSSACSGEGLATAISDTKSASGKLRTVANGKLTNVEEPFSSWIKACQENAINKILSCYDIDLVGALTMVSANICIAEGGLSKKKRSAFKDATVGKNAFEASETIITGAAAKCNEKMQISSDKDNKSVCEQHCNAKYLESLMAGSGATDQDKQTEEYISSRDKAISLAQACAANQADVIAKFSKATEAARDFKRNAGTTANAFKWGAAVGGAAIVGGIMYKNKQDDKEEKEKKQKLKKEIENGIARKEDGTKTNCLTPGTFGNPECKPILQQYCAKDENAQKGGCQAFMNKVCSEADASQSYCVSKDVKDYCKQEGPLIGQSPACIWVKNRPKSCDTDPENIQCLAAMSPAQLTAECPKFPNDPLCIAHLAGKVVTQPVSESEAAQYNTAGASNTGGLNNLIGSSDQSSITAQSNWKSTSSAYRKLCSKKQLRGCN